MCMGKNIITLRLSLRAPTDVRKDNRGYRDKSTKRYGWEVVAVTDPNILGLVDLTR